MKVFVFLAVLGVCYGDDAATIDFSCNKGADWAQKELKACPKAKTNADAICFMPAYIDARGNKYTEYGCGACPAGKGKELCTTCTNDANTLTTACNKEMPAMHAYMCTQFEMKAGKTEYSEAADKTKCMVALAATDAEVKATEACRKPVDGYKKPSTVADDKELINPCGKCSALTNAELQKNTICVDYTAGAATMSFMLAPLLAVLFWLH